MKRRVFRGAVAFAVFVHSKEGRQLINQLARSREGRSILRTLKKRPGGEAVAKFALKRPTRA